MVSNVSENVDCILHSCDVSCKAMNIFIIHVCFHLDFECFQPSEENIYVLYFVLKIALDAMSDDMPKIKIHLEFININ